MLVPTSGLDTVVLAATLALTNDTKNILSRLEGGEIMDSNLIIAAVHLAKCTLNLGVSGLG